MVPCGSSESVCVGAQCGSGGFSGFCEGRGDGRCYRAGCGERPGGGCAELAVAVVRFCGHSFQAAEVAAADEFYCDSEGCEDSSGAFDGGGAHSCTAGDGLA